MTRIKRPTSIDRAADARTIAARIAADVLADLRDYDWAGLMGLTGAEHQAVRAELAVLADRLQAALNATPDVTRYRFRHRTTGRFRAELTSAEDPAYWVLEQQRQWRGPWQPAPTTEATDV